MTTNEILQADLLDILFENKNKSYGAYNLRKKYNYRLGLSLSIVLSLVLVSVVFSFFEKGNNTSLINRGLTDSVVLTVINIPPEVEKPKEKGIRNIQTIKSVSRIEIVKSLIETDMPEQEEIVHSIISNTKITGTPLIDPNEIVNSINQDISGLLADNTTDKNFVPKEIAPSFPGGIAAWLIFLRKYLQTPDEIEAGQKVEVRVKFWIDTDGSLSRFEIVQSGGNLFDKEVLRVMRKMPKWQPALQNNSKIAVAYTQPVIFMGVEE